MMKIGEVLLDKTNKFNYLGIPVPNTKILALIIKICLINKNFMLQNEKFVVLYNCNL